MSKPIVVTRFVTKVTQSPMNPLRWCCDLECGHEQWVTQKVHPKSKRLTCDRCGRGEQ